MLLLNTVDIRLFNSNRLTILRKITYSIFNYFLVSSIKLISLFNRYVLLFNKEISLIEQNYLLIVNLLHNA